MKKQTKSAPKAAKKAAVKTPVAPKASKAVKAPVAPKASKAVKAPVAPAPVAPAPVARETKKAKALEMLANGATIFELMETFGWLRHTTRGFLSILGKTHKLEAFKNEKGEHTYKLVAA
jgi:hypothetical protein